MKKAIFSVLLGEYDELRRAPIYQGWDCIIFTDQDLKDSRGWKVFKVNVIDPKKESRLYKICSHRFIPEYDLVCYIDANIELKQEPPSHPIWFIHPTRRKITEEADKLLKTGKESKDRLSRQLNDYRRKGFRDNFGLMMNGYFVRRQIEPINKIHEAWWEHIQVYGSRDQMSWPYICWINRFQPEGLTNPFRRGQYFAIHEHKIQKIEKSYSYVHHITSGRADKNIGKAVNDIVRGLPDNDWICLRDIDTFPTYHESFFTTCEKIANSGQWDLVSCMTNRLGLPEQLHLGQIDDNFDMKYHRQIGKDRFNEHGDKVKRCSTNIGGVMMMFSKEIWNKVGFPEGGIVMPDNKFFDWHFSNAVKMAGGRIGIALGIYLFHGYRMDSDIPTRATKHLY